MYCNRLWFLTARFASRFTKIYTVGYFYLHLSVSVFPHAISITDAARINKLDVEMFHDEFWKTINFGVKRWRSQFTETSLVWVFAFLWVLAYSGFHCNTLNLIGLQIVCSCLTSKGYLHVYMSWLVAVCGCRWQVVDIFSL